MQITSTINAEILRQIGNNQGRNSEVYLAYDPQLNGEIALKEIPLHKFNHIDEYFLEAQRYYDNKHPRVAPVLYACKDAQNVRIAMPYFRNGSMQDYIESGPLTTRKLIEWSQQFLSGLHHIHSNGYIHFDIKPTNILIADDGSAMITDFGQTREMNHLGVAQNPPMYIWHLAPETLQSGSSTIHTDIYQSGLTLYRMCNGDPFFQEQRSGITHPMVLRESILNGSFPNRNKFLLHVPDRLRRVIRKALAEDPSRRYQSAIELANALGQVSHLLDWQYEKTQNRVRWYQKNVEHTFEIVLLYNQPENRWYVEGTTTRNAPLSTPRRRNAWCGGPFRTTLQGERFVASIFREMEG
jgi:serine/threonine protein kinase